jgi:glycosyltransferase involved in cell wall biosynthesis
VYYRTLITAELGVSVDLLTYGQGQDVEIPGVRIHRIPRFAFLGEVKVGPSLLKFFLDFFLVLRTIGLLLRHRYDFVHAHEEAVFFCRFLKPIFGFKLVYDMHSSLPQQLTNFRFTTSRLLIGLFRRLENSCLEACDAVITICPDLADQVAREIQDLDKHFLIENSIFDPVRLVGESSSVTGSEAAGTAERELPADRQIVVYAGTLEPYQGIELLLRAFQRVWSERPEAFLLIAGGTTAQVEHYSGLAQELGLDSACLFTGRVPPDRARKLSTEADLLVSPRIEGTNTPLKVYEQLASGVALVATDIYSHTQVLDDSVAFLAKPNDEGFAGALSRALDEPEERARRVAGARDLYQRRYSRSAYLAKMSALLDRLR